MPQRAPRERPAGDSASHLRRIRRPHAAQTQPATSRIFSNISAAPGGSGGAIAGEGPSKPRSESSEGDSDRKFIDSDGSAADSWGSPTCLRQTRGKERMRLQPAAAQPSSKQPSPIPRVRRPHVNRIMKSALDLQLAPLGGIWVASPNCFTGMPQK